MKKHAYNVNLQKHCILSLPIRSQRFPETHATGALNIAFQGSDPQRTARRPLSARFGWVGMFAGVSVCILMIAAIYRNTTNIFSSCYNI